jgi:RHS repeat-associated protein
MRYQFLYTSGLPVEIRRGGSSAIRMEYDKGGNLSALFDGKARPQRFEYDEANRLKAFSDRLGGVTRYKYHRDGPLSTITTPKGSVWRSTYEKTSQLSSISYPDGTVEQYSPAHSPTRVVRRNGESVSLAHDRASNLTQAEYPGGLTVKLSYNSFGHLLTSDNGTHRTRIEYTDFHYRSSEEMDGRRIELQFDDAQLLTRLTNHRGEGVGFSYGADQRVNRIQDWNGRDYHLSYDAGGRLTGITFPNGARMSQSFAPLGTLQSQSFTGPGRAEFARSYEYDANDVLVQVADSQNGAKRHTTDAEDRLIAVSSPLLQREYAYDAHGNLVSAGPRHYTYDSLDQISGSTEGAFVYDALGNLVESGADGRKVRFSYNGQNQLTRAALPDGRIAEYEYDALGRRVVKRFGPVTTTYTWWGEQLIAEDSDGVTPERVDYLFLPGTYRLLAMRVNGATYYVHTDHLECPIRVVDDSGHVRWAAEPHGYEYPILVNEIRQPFRFPGQYCDEETGLHYNRHRYFDPRSGRYLSPDPLFFRDRTNLYLYAAGNPTLFCDPTGLFLPLLIIGGALLIGAALGAGHSIASDLSQGKSPNWGNAAVAAGKGVLVAAGGLVAAAIAVATLPVTAPAAAVVAIGAVGAFATGAVMAGVSAPEGQKAQACAESLPFVRQFTHDYENDPRLNYPTAQRVIDASFDLLSLGLMAKGFRSGQGATVADVRASLTRPPVAPKTLERLGPASKANTNRSSEHPYANPPEMIEVKPGEKLDLSQLDPDRVYVWAMGDDGTMRLAPTDQPAFLESKQGPQPQTEVKHGDLFPGEDGKSRGAASAGGEMRVVRDGDGNPSGVWEMNNDSSYTFNRADGATTTGDNLQAASDVLGEGGTDTGKILVNNTHGSDAPTGE